MKKIIVLVLFIAMAICPVALAKNRLNQEKYYMDTWAKQHNGITEYVLPDRCRVDCVTKDYAIEFDFADKWAEAIGQSLYYGICLNKKPAIVLIMENYQRDFKYLKRVQIVAKEHGITVFTICP